MSEATTRPEAEIENPPLAAGGRPRAWPLWASMAGAARFFSTVIFDTRAAGDADLHHTVSVVDMAGLDHVMYRRWTATGARSPATAPGVRSGIP